MGIIRGAADPNGRASDQRNWRHDSDKRKRPTSTGRPPSNVGALPMRRQPPWANLPRLTS
jgi:hypothetical protein